MPRTPIALAAAAAAATVALAAARPAAAQFIPGLPGGNAAPVRFRNLATVSPIHALFGALVLDYEYAVRRDLTLGLAGGYTDANNFVGRPRRGDADREVSATARYYLTGSAPVGSALGLTAGALVAERTDQVGGAAVRRTTTLPTVGITFDFNQTFGRSRRFVVATGTGIKRRFVGSGPEFQGVSDQQWTFRLNVGYAW